MKRVFWIKLASENQCYPVSRASGQCAALPARLSFAEEALDAAVAAVEIAAAPGFEGPEKDLEDSSGKVFTLESLTMRTKTAGNA